MQLIHRIEYLWMEIVDPFKNFSANGSNLALLQDRLGDNIRQGPSIKKLHDNLKMRESYRNLHV